jgi:uncharacterized integral membrane protein
MRIFGIFVWIIIGAIILWFFAMNLDQHVDIQLFQKTYQDVNLIVVIFISFIIGTIVGAIILSSHVLTSKSEVRALKKDRAKLMKELDGLRNVSIDEIPEPDTKINRPANINPEQE